MLTDLADYSARLGKNPAVIQGAGGNTSMKVEEGGRRILYVKASGLWLSRAREHPTFVGLALDPLLERLARAIAEPDIADLVVHAPTGMRHSIETSLHAVMPHRVVTHTHSVAAIAHLVQTGSERALGERLAGLRWTHVPYARPGLPLLRAVEAAGGQHADVLMLANHGLVFGAPDTESAARLHAELEERLALPVRLAPPGNPEQLSAIGRAHGWRPASLAEAHALGTDPASFELAGRGSLYPDHVVFLGAGPVQQHTDFAAAERSAKKLILIEGLGALVPATLSKAGEEMVRCLALVLSRVRPGSDLIVLDTAAEYELAHWDAEAFRRSLGGEA